MPDLRISVTLTFDHPVTAFALVVGGWYPLSLATGRVILIDRNVLGIISQLGKRTHRHDSVANNWWLEYLDSEHCVLNPVLCAMEGAGRKRPSETEFRDSFTLACAAIRQRLPRARLIEFGDESVRAALQTIEDSDARYLAESRFLIEACPYISDRRPYAELRRTEEAVLQSARQCELDLFSLPVLAVLSCLYERQDGHEPLIGRKVIKPCQGYDESRAHNALSDLHALEYLAAASGLGPANLAYCTRDKHLAALWCSLRFAAGRWRTNDVEVDLRPGGDLFPRLSEDEIDALFERLGGQRG